MGGANADPRDIDLVDVDRSDRTAATTRSRSAPARRSSSAARAQDTIIGGSGTNIILGDNGEIDGVSGHPPQFGALPITVGLVQTTYPGAQRRQRHDRRRRRQRDRDGRHRRRHDHDEHEHELRLRRRRPDRLDGRAVSAGPDVVGREHRPDGHRSRRVHGSDGRRQRHDHRRLRPGDRRRRLRPRHDHRRRRARTSSSATTAAIYARGARTRSRRSSARCRSPSGWSRRPIRRIRRQRHDHRPARGNAIVMGGTGADRSRP